MIDYWRNQFPESSRVSLKLVVNNQIIVSTCLLSEKTTFKSVKIPANTLVFADNETTGEYSFTISAGEKTRITGKLNTAKPGKDQFSLKKCKISPPEQPFEPTDISVKIDDLQFNADLLRNKPDKLIFTHRGNENPKLKIKLDLENKFEWSVKITNAEFKNFNVRDGIIVTLQLDGLQAQTQFDCIYKTQLKSAAE